MAEAIAQLLANPERRIQAATHAKTAAAAFDARATAGRVLAIYEAVVANLGSDKRAARATALADLPYVATDL
jgi:hypothetical protein